MSNLDSNDTAPLKDTEADTNEISETIKSTLDRRWAEFEMDPGIAMGYEEVVEFVRQNRGYRG